MNKLFLFAFALLACALFSHPAIAAGRVYGSDHKPLCHSIASIDGVYAVWSDSDPLHRAQEIQIVLTPGARAADVASHVRDFMARRPHETHLNSIVIDLWTYHDTLEGADFRQTIGANEFFISPIGFHDYRGTKVMTVSAEFDPETGSLIGDWRVNRVYDDPARVRAGVYSRNAP